MQLKFFQVKTSYQLIEMQTVFYSNKNGAHNTQQIKVYYAQCTPGNKIQLDTGFERTRKLIERGANVPSLLLEQYNGSI